jgi:hypothetical protein
MSIILQKGCNLIVLFAIGLYYKHITIVYDDSIVVNKWLKSLTDNNTVVIYNRNKFLI